MLGDVAFHNLVTDYLLRIRRRTSRCATPAATCPALLARARRRGRIRAPADLARFEWALIDAFDAADAPALDAARSRPCRRSAGRPCASRCTRRCACCACGWPVHDVRAACRSRRAAADPAAGGTPLCVWRQDLRVFHRPVDAAGGAALPALRAGATFGEVCDRRGRGGV